MGASRYTRRYHAYFSGAINNHVSERLHSKYKVVTLTAIHIILVAVSQGMVTLPCSDMVCWHALCAPALYAPLYGSSLSAVTTTGIGALKGLHRPLELQWTATTSH